LFLVFAFLVSKEIKKNIIKKNLSIRLASIYTLFASSIITIASTLVTVIYTWLMGSTDTAFFLKSSAISALAVFLFVYFFYSLKRDYSKKTIYPVMIAVLSSVIVLAGIIWSINISGSPSKVRSVKLDEQKLQDINNIKYSIQAYMQDHNKLPNSLEDLYDKSSIYDKETRNKYDYQVLFFSEKDNLLYFSYKLCTHFHLSSDRANSINSYFWQKHDAGYQCFTVTDSIRSVNYK
jgi:heme/copper-type cytochrome/quinol oxidase subunit 4